MLARLSIDLRHANSRLSGSTGKQIKCLKKGKSNGVRHVVHKRFFERSSVTVDLIENSKLTSFAQFVIGDVPVSRPGGNSLQAHVIHNNAYSVPPGGRGQAPSWHVDDPMQQIIIEEGSELPSNVRLPILATTCMLWLSDCTTVENGPTHIVPGSHRLGKVVDPELAERRGIPMCGSTGTAIFINPNVWHRGCQNISNVPRDTFQITYARRIIGHKFGSIMNYVMPENVLKKRNQKTKERMGFLEGGAYS
jgi:ectoine hydroxylase-related dioxygenase (phytanoyl-CoA dioxygenase family)